MKQLNFCTFGDKNNPPVFLIHGLFGSWENLKTLAKALSQTHFIIAVDCRNHGESFKEDTMNYQIMANDFEQLITHLNITKPSIVGHSMGGKIAMTIALRKKHPINKLIIIDIAPKPYPPHHTSIIKELLAIDLTKFTHRSDVDMALAKQIPNQILRQFLLKNITKSSNGLVWKIHLKSIHNNYNKISKFLNEDIQWDGQCLFIRGKKSNYIEIHDELLIKQWFPNATIETIDASHWVHAEKPSETALVINHFLNLK